MAIAAAALAMAGCSQFGTTGIQLRVDRSIRIVEPADRSTVPVPLTVRWEDDRPIDGGSYAVILDRAPMPPGDTVEWFARDDDECRPDPGCPDELWLARRGITVTPSTSVEIAIVPDNADGSARHELTVVRLDADGRRADEAAFVVPFEVDDGNG